MFIRKIHRRLDGNFTFLICTDRLDPDGQPYETFAKCELVNNDREQLHAGSDPPRIKTLTLHYADASAGSSMNSSGGN